MVAASAARSSVLTQALPWLAAAVATGGAAGAAAGAPSPEAAAGVAVLVAAAAVAARPGWLPAVLAITIFAEAVTVGGVTVGRIAAPIALAVVALRVAAGGVRLPHKAVLVVAAAYAAWALASTLWTLDERWTLDSPGTAFALTSLAIALTYLLAFGVLVESRADLRRLLGAVWAAAVVLGIAVVVGYAGDGERGSGLPGDPNFFAVFQVIALPLAVAFAGAIRHPLARWLVYAGGAVIAASVVASLSRGGLLALCAVLVLLAIQPARAMFRTTAAKAAFVAIALAGAGALGAAAYGDLATRTAAVLRPADAGSGRLYVWSAAWTAVEQRPLVGLGYGAFQPASNDLLRQTPSVDLSVYRLRERGQPAHNSYLEALAELGPVGLALFTAMLGAAALSLRSTARRARDAGDAELARVARAMLVGLAGFAVSALFLSAQTNRGPWLLLGLSLALPRLVTPVRRARSPARTRRRRTYR